MGNEKSQISGPIKEPVKPEVKPGPWKADWTNAVWTEILSMALEDFGQEIIKYAPKGKAGAIMLMTSLARFESNFKPEASYTEKFEDASGNHVVSRGLFMLSIESVNGPRYRCGIKKAAELHDPAINIICAVKVANALIKEDAVLYGHSLGGKWYGLSRYWSPFRDDAKRTAIMKKVDGLA